jgi:peptidoglycan lytic transglycosylase
MRTFLFSALSVLTLGLLMQTPASAENAPWKCIGPAVACADSKPSWRARDSRSSRKDSRRAERSYGKRSRSARREEPRRQRTATNTSSRSYSGGSHGMASYYGSESGSRTASGARFVPSAMTAAHRSLPFGTKVRVTNKRNGRSVVVTINDRGPFIRGRIIDLSSGAAGVIGMRSSGVAPVSVEVLGRNG